METLLLKQNSFRKPITEQKQKKKVLIQKAKIKDKHEKPISIHKNGSFATETK
jgi:hypothetical protein